MSGRLVRLCIPRGLCGTALLLLLCLSLDAVGRPADAAGPGPRAGSSVTPVAPAAPALPATQPSICLADEWSIQGLFNSLSATHLIQIAIIGGCIALYILFRAKGG